MNVFLTGEINCGKSTLINGFLAEYKGRVSGYRTIRAKTHLDDFFGIYLLDINDSVQNMNAHNRVGDCFADRSLICFENVFNTIGVNLLDGYEESDIVIMDEIGALEKDCKLFTDKVFEVLDSETSVLGVIKQKDTPYLNKIRRLDDVKIIEVTGANNKEIAAELRKLFSQ